MLIRGLIIALRARSVSCNSFGLVKEVLEFLRSPGVPSVAWNSFDLLELLRLLDTGSDSWGFIGRLELILSLGWCTVSRNSFGLSELFGLLKLIWFLGNGSGSRNSPYSRQAALYS